VPAGIVPAVSHTTIVLGVNEFHVDQWVNSVSGLDFKLEKEHVALNHRMVGSAAGPSNPVKWPPCSLSDPRRAADLVVFVRDTTALPKRVAIARLAGSHCGVLVRRTCSSFAAEGQFLLWNVPIA